MMNKLFFSNSRKRFLFEETWKRFSLLPVFFKRPSRKRFLEEREKSILRRGIDEKE